MVKIPVAPAQRIKLRPDRDGIPGATRRRHRRKAAQDGENILPLEPSERQAAQVMNHNRLRGRRATRASGPNPPWAAGVGHGRGPRTRPKAAKAA